MSLNLKQFGVVSLGAFLLVSVGFLCTTLFSQHRANEVELHQEAQAKMMMEVVLPLVAKTKDIRFDVVQVQQWLTDVSATRGLDGGLCCAAVPTALLHSVPQFSEKRCWHKSGGPWHRSWSPTGQIRRRWFPYYSGADD